MATLTKEQIEHKKQQLKQLAEEVKQLTKELVEAGAIELSEEDFEKVTGGVELLHSPAPQQIIGHAGLYYPPVAGVSPSVAFKGVGDSEPGEILPPGK